jgi:hypothetical protein
MRRSCSHPGLRRSLRGDGRRSSALLQETLARPRPRERPVHAGARHPARFAGARQEAARMGNVDIWWGDARQLLPSRLRGQRIDFLFLDGLPRESLEYLQAGAQDRGRVG